MLLLSRLSYQSLFHSWTLLCRRLHPVMPLRMRPRRRLISLSPRYLLTLKCRRLSTVSTLHLWTLPCRRSHTVLFLRTFLRRWVLAQLPRFLLTRLSRLLFAVLYHTILPHNYRSRISLLDVSSLSILLIVRARYRYKATRVSLPPHPDMATTCTLSRSSLDCDDHLRTLAPRVLLQPPPSLERNAPPPGLDIDAHLCTPHGIPAKAAPLRPWLRSAISVTPPQLPACTIHVGTHPVRSAATGKRSASTALAGTNNPVDTDPRAGTGPFPKPRALVLPLVHLGHGGIDTADSDLMHHQFRLSLLQWNPGPARRALLTLSPLPVASFMQSFSRKPATMFRTSPISSRRTLATRTLLSCSTRTPLSLTL